MTGSRRWTSETSTTTLRDSFLCGGDLVCSPCRAGRQKIALLGLIVSAPHSSLLSPFPLSLARSERALPVLGLETGGRWAWSLGDLKVGA